MTQERISKSRFLRLLPRRFGTDERGVAAIEFALVLPLILILLLGCFEVPRFVLVNQRLARTSHSVADLIAQGDDPISYGQMTDVFKAGKMIMQPFDIETNGKIFVSSINNPTGTNAVVTWQRTNGSAKDTSGGTITSKVGTQGGNATLPSGLSPPTGDEVLVAEVYFNYKPVFGTLIYKGSTLYSVSYYRPRNKNLTTPPPTQP